MSKKKIVFLCVLAAVLVLAAGTVLLLVFTFPQGDVLSEEKAGEIRASRAPVSDDSLNMLTINGVEAAYDAAENIYYYTLTKDDAWETLRFAGDPEKGAKAAVTKDYTATPKKAVISRGEGIPVMIYDDTAYREAAIVFSYLPILNIDTKQLPAELHYEDEQETLDEYYAVEHSKNSVPPDDHAALSEDPDKPIGEDNVYASVRLIDAEAREHGYENGYTSKARIHARGRSSMAYPKNSYKLELLKHSKEDENILVERNEPLLGMRNDGDWILNGMYAENTKIRDKLASDLWLKVTEKQKNYGVNNGWETAYVEVVINGRYWGLYVMSERVDKKQLGLQDGDYMYFSEADLGKRAEDFEGITDKTTVQGYELEYPLPITEPYVQWNAFHDLVKLVQSKDVRDDKKAQERINMESLVNYWVYVQAVFGVDNLIQNTYYISRASEGGAFSFVPWDMDQTFGWGWVNEDPKLPTGGKWLYNHEALLEFWVSSGLLQGDTCHFKQLVNDRYEELRGTILSTASMCEMARDLSSEIVSSGAYRRNEKRWPDGSYVSGTTELTTFITQHMSFLDQEIPNLIGKKVETTRLWK